MTALNTVTLVHPLSVDCPVCGAAPDNICSSMAKRWQAERCRTAGIGMNGWRKTPHKERVLASRAENDRRRKVVDRANALGIKIGEDEGVRAARYFGAECGANPGAGFYDYADDIALYFGFDSWGAMPDQLSKSARALFREACEREARLSRRGR